MRLQALFIALALLLLLLPIPVPAQPPQYLVIGPLYPFTDLNLLVEMADLCYQNALPFVLLVAPVYQNTEFPAMARFCDALEYAQYRGGTVLMREALMLAREQAQLPLEQKLALATQGYASHGITPAQIQVADSVFEGSFWLSPTDGLQAVTQTIADIRAQRLVIRDYATDNGLHVERDYQPKPLKPYQWRRGFQGAYELQLFVVDRWLQIVVLAFSIVLVLIIALGFRINRRKNLRSPVRRRKGEKHANHR